MCNRTVKPWEFDLPDIDQETVHFFMEWVSHVQGNSNIGMSSGNDNLAPSSGHTSNLGGSRRRQSAESQVAQQSGLQSEQLQSASIAPSQGANQPGLPSEQLQIEGIAPRLWHTTFSCNIT